MPVDNHKTYRFMILDQCVRNRHRHYTIDDLVDVCNKGLEKKGYRPISKRTIQQDLSDMELSPYCARFDKIKDGHKTIYRYSDTFPGINLFEFSDDEKLRIDSAIKVLEYSIIRNLCKHADGKAPNIVIIYNFGKAATTFKTIIGKIKQVTKEVTNEESNVTLVDISRAEHDRYIITNYKRFKSGDSFTYFDGNNKATKGRDFTIVSHYDRDNLENSVDILADLQVLVDQKKSAAIPGVQGDKVSYLLNF